jgi:tetratricopeptide (TPR) repeat protein
VSAFVLPVHPDARSLILASYAARLAAAPDDIPALTGASFARWYFFDYGGALQVLDQLLAVKPDDLYGNLFRGSTRVLLTGFLPQGIADLEYALALAPNSPDVHFIVADAYLYGRSDYARAFDEATLALDGGLDTPRVHAILAASYLSFGNLPSGAAHLERHIELVTTQLMPAAPLTANTTLSLDLVPGRTYEIPVPVTAGQTISITTNSQDFTDTIMVLLAPGGTPVTGNDDYRRYFAGFQWTAPAAGTYRLLATSFESTSIGELQVMHK